MTSPVDFISGDSSVSTPGNLLKERIGLLDADEGIFFIAESPNSGSLLPSITFTAIFARGTPVVFDTKGTVLARPGGSPL